MGSFSCHLGFDGSCDEAMKFYAKILGATPQFRMTWAESPMCDQVGPEFQDKIMHAAIKVGETVLMAADSPPGSYQKPQGIVVSYATPDLDAAKKAFDALAECGSVQMPFAETFWAEGFGMCTDKYSIPWMVNCEKLMQTGA